VLALFLISIGPSKIGRFSVWARWAIVVYVVLAVVIPALLGMRSVSPSAGSNEMMILRSWVRKFWISMLVLNIGAFVVGAAMVFMLRNIIEVRYVILAPCVNLLFIVLLYWFLYFTKKSRSFPDKSGPEQ
jgi:hypothetical protein